MSTICQVTKNGRNTVSRVGGDLVNSHNMCLTSEGWNQQGSRSLTSEGLNQQGSRSFK